MCEFVHGQTHVLENVRVYMYDMYIARGKIPGLDSSELVLPFFT